MKGISQVANVAFMQVARIDAGSHRVEPTPVAHGAFVAIAIQVSGQAMLTQERRVTRLGPQEWTLCDASSPYALTCTTPGTRLVLLVPSNRIAHEVMLPVALRRAFPAMRGASLMLVHTTKLLIQQMRHLNCPVVELAAQAITDLLNAALVECGAARNWLSARLPLSARMRAYILAHLRNTPLSIDTVAKALGVSRGRLLRAAREERVSIHNLIWQGRLEGAHRDLQDTLHEAAIGSVARSWGFRDVSHFSRLFRARFGMAPSTYRRRVRQQVRLTRPTDR